MDKNRRMEALVLVPGLNNTGAVFDGVADALAGHAHVHTPTCDALGSVEAIADSLAARLPERFWLGGFSFGGHVALAMLERCPQRIQGISLICTSPFADSGAQKARRLLAIERVRAGEYRELIAEQAVNAFHPHSLSNASLLAERAAMAREYGPQRFIAHSKALMARPDRRALLTGNIPTLIVAASHDKVVPPSVVTGFGTRIPGAEVACIDGAGHLAPMERPRELAHLLRGWMQNSLGRRK